MIRLSGVATGSRAQGFSVVWAPPEPEAVRTVRRDTRMLTTTEAMRIPHHKAASCGITPSQPQGEYRPEVFMEKSCQ